MTVPAYTAPYSIVSSCFFAPLCEYVRLPFTPVVSQKFFYCFFLSYLRHCENGGHLRQRIAVDRWVLIDIDRLFFFPLTGGPLLSGCNEGHVGLAARQH